MDAQNIHVIPAAWMAAARSIAATNAIAAEVDPAALPPAAAGTPADDAWGPIAARIISAAEQMSARIAAAGPRIEARTDTGAAVLTASDGENAADIGAVAPKSL